MGEPGLRVGVYVDAENLSRNGGERMQYRVLRNIACRENGQPIRLNTYIAFDERRAETDRTYRDSMLEYYSAVRDAGFKIIEKKVQHFIDPIGVERSKANADLDMAVDSLLQSEHLDRVVLGTGDGDFVQVVRALQNRGCRVEIIAFDNVSGNLRREADQFLSGYLVPGLVPTAGKPWGQPGSRVRGVCYYYPGNGKEVGFFRFLERPDGNLWLRDERDEHSPYASAAFHVNNMPAGFDATLLPSREIVFEFELESADGYERPRAKDISVCYKYPSV
ncbi:MAG TPA: NYN domain-containing protein [Vicinamibacterales bacterium]|jgi:uncharacterized LabA/DUF88 family protein|nr:NYN domain-containing protein [Vicinamibacterales bacterium]